MKKWRDQSHKATEWLRQGSNLEWWGRDSFYYYFNIWHWNFPRERNVVMIYCCLVAKSCLTLCNPMDCRPPSSSVHEISQTRILEWIATSFSSSNVYVWWVFFFFFNLFLAVLVLHCSVQAFSSCGEQGLLLWRVSYCNGFSCWAEAPACTGFGSCGSRAPEIRISICGAQV